MRSTQTVDLLFCAAEHITCPLLEKLNIFMKTKEQNSLRINATKEQSRCFLSNCRVAVLFYRSLTPRGYITHHCLSKVHTMGKRISDELGMCYETQTLASPQNLSVIRSQITQKLRRLIEGFHLLVTIPYLRHHSHFTGHTRNTFNFARELILPIVAVKTSLTCILFLVFVNTSIQKLNYQLLRFQIIGLKYFFSERK